MIRELRIACTVAQMEREGGISPRVSPLAQVGTLLQNSSLLSLNCDLKGQSLYSFQAVVSYACM